MSVVISISVIGVFHLSLWLTCFVVVLSRLEPKLILPRNKTKYFRLRLKDEAERERERERER